MLNYDADITDPGNPTGSLYGTDNSLGEFSPSLLIQSVAQPATISGITMDENSVELTVSNSTPRVVSNIVERTSTINPADWVEGGTYLSGPGVTNWSESLAPGSDQNYYRIQTE